MSKEINNKIITKILHTIYNILKTFVLMFICILFNAGLIIGVAIIIGITLSILLKFSNFLFIWFHNHLLIGSVFIIWSLISWVILVIIFLSDKLFLKKKKEELNEIKNVEVPKKI